MENLSMPRKIVLLMCIALMSFGLNAQRHEIGVKSGLAYLVGDIGATEYVFQSPITERMTDIDYPFFELPVTIGIMYRRNFNPYQSLRLDVGYSQVKFLDRRSDEIYRKNRGSQGINSGLDVNVLFEYNFFPVNNEQQRMLSPYIFGGLGFGIYGNRSLNVNVGFEKDASGNIVQNPDGSYPAIYSSQSRYETKMIIAVPFGIGLKYKFNYNWAVSLEAMFRPTFSDGLDYSAISSKDVDIAYSRERLQPESARSVLQQEPYTTEAKRIADEVINNVNVGNTNSKDWLNTITLGLSYSFGRPPCYCD
ncbi:MAG: DUF6089 family protein [Bergeyella zoohelcum]|nr:DUF6089 family protein [Bergeyella zoohelcum]